MENSSPKQHLTQPHSTGEDKGGREERSDDRTFSASAARVIPDHTSPQKYFRENLPNTQCEVQHREFLWGSCVAVVNYETGEVIHHADLIWYPQLM